MNTENEDMRKKFSDIDNKDPEVPRPDVETWAKGLAEFSLFPPKKPEAALTSIQKATSLGTPLPFTLTFCPADKKVETPGPENKRFELVPLTSDCLGPDKPSRNYLVFLSLQKDL